jgi:hypothetical protein
MEELDKLETNKVLRDEKGRILPGQPSINPAGRPKGKGLKEYDRAKFAEMSDIEKEAFLQTISPELRYRMAEGNPAQDVTSDGKQLPTPIYIPRDESIEEDSTAKEEN